MRYYSRILLIVAFYTTLILLSGCGGKNSPKSQVTDMFIAYKQNDFDRMSSYTLHDNSTAFKYKEYIESNIDENTTIEFLKKNIFIPAILEKSKFDVKSEKISKESATVSVTIKCPDLKTIVTNLSKQENIVNLSNDEIEKAIQDEISKSSISSYDFDLKLQKINNKWFVDINHYYVQDALSGGLLSVYNELYEKSLEELKESIHGGNQQ